MVDEPLDGKKLYHIQDYFGHDFVEYEKFIEYADMNRQALVGVYFSEKDVKSAVAGLRDEILGLKATVYSEMEFTDGFPDDIQQAYLDCYNLFLSLIDKWFKDVIV